MNHRIFFPLALLALPLVLLGSSGCFFGSVESGCSEKEPCPAGFACSADGLCLQAADGGGGGTDGGGTDGGSGTDGGGSGTGLCQGQTCSGHGVCVESGTVATCDCDPGYLPAGLACDPAGPAPTAVFTPSPSSAGVAERVDLDASASTSSNGPLRYRWDFEGDGIFDTLWLSAATVSHSFFVPATFGVTLEVEDPAKLRAQSTVPISVSRAATTPTWIGVANNAAGGWGWWTVLDLGGAKISDTEIFAFNNSSSYTSVRGARVASDGRVMVAVQCRSTLTCLGHEIAVVGAGGKSGVFSKFTPDFVPYDVLELPDGRWLVSGREAGGIIVIDVNGDPVEFFAENLAGPTGLELSADATEVLVALADGGRIERFALDGTDLGRFDQVGFLSVPYTLRRAADGAYLVADLSGSIEVFEQDGLHRSRRIGTPDITVPRGLVELPDGRLIFGEDCTAAADDRCGSLRVYDPTTGGERLFAPQPGDPWNINNPVSLILSN